MRSLADENFPLPSVECLRAEGHDVAAVIVDSPGAADEQVLQRVVNEAHIKLTFDRDFGRLLFQSRLPAPRGLVYFRFQPSVPREPADLLLRLLATEQVSLEGRLTVVDDRQMHQRPLL